MVHVSHRLIAHVVLSHLNQLAKRFCTVFFLFCLFGAQLLITRFNFFGGSAAKQIIFFGGSKDKWRGFSSRIGVLVMGQI